MSHSTQKPSAGRGIALIIKRELGHYFYTWSGYIIAASMLLLSGLFFNVFAVGSAARFSNDVLADCFYYLSGTTIVSGLLFSMRLIAEERQTGTLPMLTTSSLTDGQIIFAKFLSGYAFLCLYLLSTLWIPALVFANGMVSLGHIVAGYLGLALIGASTVAIGVFGSAIVRSQLVAVIVSGAITVVLLLLWMTARLVEGPLGDVVGYLALHDKHFRPFMEGTVTVSNILFYVSVTAFFLALARSGLEARRWRA